MVFYIKAKVAVKVRGISGVFNEVRSHLVHANDSRDAQNKFENRIRRDKENAAPEDVNFEYLEIATEIF